MSEIVKRVCLEDPNSVQFGLITEIHEALRSRSIPHWLGGGWALDFLLGEVSRLHGDIDWAIWKTDAPEVTACLGTLGYSKKEVRHPDEHIGFCRLDQYVSFGLLEKTQSGDVVTSGRLDRLALSAWSLLCTGGAAGRPILPDPQRRGPTGREGQLPQTPCWRTSERCRSYRDPEAAHVYCGSAPQIEEASRRGYHVHVRFRADPSRNSFGVRAGRDLTGNIDAEKD